MNATRSQSIFLYHHLTITSCPFTRYLSVNHHPSLFTRQIEVLHNSRELRSLSQLSKLPEHQDAAHIEAAIYFDDGYYSFIEHALPLLEQYKIPVTLCINSAALDQGITWLNKLSWLLSTLAPHEVRALARKALPTYYSETTPTVREYIDNFDERHTAPAIEGFWKEHGCPMPEKKLYLDCKDLRELATNNLISWGSHTAHHYPLHRVSYTTARDEICSCHRYLESLLKQNVPLFSYPFARVGTHKIARLVESIADSVVIARRNISQKFHDKALFSLTAPQTILRLRKMMTTATRQDYRRRLRPELKASIVRYSELLAFADSLESLPKTSLIPITRQRAEIMVQHPGALPDEVALYLVWSSAEEIGLYWGVLPGSISNKTSRYYVAWSSSGAARKDLQGKGLSARCFKEIQQHTAIFCAVGNNTAARRTYSYLGLSTMSRLTGFLINMRLFDAQRIVQKLCQLIGVPPAWSHLLKKKHNPTASLNSAHLRSIGFLEQIGISIARSQYSQSARSLLDETNETRWYRDSATVEWMANNPYCASLIDCSNREQEYFFLPKSKLLRYYRWEIRSGYPSVVSGAGLIQVVVNLHLQTTTIRGLDTKLIDTTDKIKYLLLLLLLSITHKADYLELPTNSMLPLFTRLAPRILLKSLYKEYVYWTESPEHQKMILEAHCSLADGDLGMF